MPQSAIFITPSTHSGRSFNHPMVTGLMGGLCAIFLSTLSACADQESTLPPTQCTPSSGALPHEKLSEYCFFEGEMKNLTPAYGVVEFQVAAPLWSDHAEKQRLIKLPAEGKIHFTPDENWEYPVGTILVKTFSFRDDFRDSTSPRHTLETRLLILGEAGWSSEIYRWNDEQTDAARMIAGERVDVTYIDEDGVSNSEEYIVPNQNQCKSCHERNDKQTFLGPFTQQLNRTVTVNGEAKNQLTHLAELGLFDSDFSVDESLPAFADPFGDAPVDERARAYLHANCSHCHRPGGGGGPSGLVLLEWEKTPLKNGICKESAAAGQGTGGHTFDIVPGAPDESIIVFRMSSTDPDIKMPELPNRVPDKKGVALIKEWIGAMSPPGCN
ncbi:MAG: hypothetical protein IPK82_00350 [Polyangiaceae bacterium]|nr:hypothetical protein [Polyangiaceae bacterium]